MADYDLILSGFADESAREKTIEQQFIAFAALGFEYLSLRFIDAGNGIKNLMQLQSTEIDLILRKLEQYGLQISSLGSPIGKTKLLDIDDGTDNSFFNFDLYLENHVEKACQIARRFNCRLIRGFSFYHPKNENPLDFIDEAARRLAAIASICDSHHLTFGLEVEANLIGQNAETLLAIHQSVNSDALVLIFDGANLVTQGYSQQQVIQQFREMEPALGWIHIKDHLPSTTGTTNAPGKYVDEESLHQFVPAGSGASGYPQILTELKSSLSKISERMRARGVAGVFADLEPHLRGGGQFGGYSGPDGFGVATRAFCQLCEAAEISCQLRDHDSIFSTSDL